MPTPTSYLVSTSHLTSKIKVEVRKHSETLSFCYVTLKINLR